MKHPILATLAVALASSFSSAAMAQLSGPDRSNFIASSVKGCTETVQSAKADISAEKTSAYCGCMANKQADMTTPDDLAYYSAHQTLSDDYIKRVQALGPACKAAAGLGD